MNKSKGFTFVEILVVTGIILVAGLLLVGVIVNFTGISLQQSSKVSQGVSINDSFMKIREIIKSAAAVAVSYPETGSPLYTSSSSNLVLKVSSVDSSGNLISSIFDYFVFYLDQNILRLKTYPNVSSSRQVEDQVFSTSIDSVQFQYLNNTNPEQQVAPELASKIRITVTLSQKLGAGYETTIATSEARLRND